MNLARGILSNRIKEILRSIDYYSKFGRVKKPRDFRRVYAYHVDHIWHLDLMEFTGKFSEENDGFRYCLVCIDVISKYVWVTKMRSKSTSHLFSALNKIFVALSDMTSSSEFRYPKIIFMDGESAFFSTKCLQVLNSLGIKAAKSTTTM